MSGVNKSLRRKPPPLLEKEQGNNTYPDIYSSNSAPLLIPEKPPKVLPSQNFCESRRPENSFTIDENTSHDSDDTNEYADSSLLSYESPRPKGPQNLPVDDSFYMTNESVADELLYRSQSEPNSPSNFRQNHITDTYDKGMGISVSGQMTTTSRPIFNGACGSMTTTAGSKESHTSSLLPKNNMYRQRKFQNLSQKGTSPFVTLGSEAEKWYDQSDRKTYETAVKHDAESPMDLPYPISDAVSSYADDYLEDYHYDEFGKQTRADSKTPVLTTPTRIPSLANKDSMRVSQKHPLEHRTSAPDFRFLRRSSTRYVNSASTSPESQQNFSSSSSSPTRASLYGRSPLTYSETVSDNRSSRSPSPRKHAPASSGAYGTLYPYDENYSNVFEDYFNEERVPRWSLIESDGFDNYDDSFNVSPAEARFDYTNLPELPKLSDDSFEKSLSFIDPHVVDKLQATPTIRRKHDDLPPVPLDLPPLPFSPSALTALHFATCENVWSLSSIFEWCLKLNKWCHGHLLTLKEFKKVLMRLVAFHRQDIPIDLITRNVHCIIESFTQSNLLLFESDPNAYEYARRFRFHVHGNASGVLVDLTSCYGSDVNHTLKGYQGFAIRCYSSHCTMNRTIEHENLMRTTNIHELVLGEDWASHWKLAAHDMAIDLSETKKQSFLFDLIKFEQNFIQRAECFVDIAGPEFIKSAKLMVISHSSISAKDFEDKILSSARSLLSIHREVLYKPLLNILVADGKFLRDINALADLYREWAYAAKSPLLAYMSAMPMIEDIMEIAAMKQWDQIIRLNPRIKALQVNGNLLLMSTFNSRYQQLPLQLLDIRKYFDEEDYEYASLTKAVDAIRQLGTKVNEMKVHSDNVHALKLVEKQLTWKTSVFQPRLNLKSSCRRFYYRGDLIRKGDLKINSHSVHMIVLDNYLIVTEKQRGQRLTVYKVTESPIPLDYLIVENRDTQASFHITENTEGEETSSYAFKIRYAGRGKSECHTLVATSEKERKKWISMIVQAKSNLLKRVIPLIPYNFELVENRFFAYDPSSRMTKLPILCSADPLSKLAKEVSAMSQASPLSQVQRMVQCSCVFYFINQQLTFLGTDSGVYCSDGKNIWKKIINMNNVTKLTVLPELNVVLVMANKSLRYYPLQSLVNIYYEKKDRITSYQLSNESILFYEFGRHRGLPSLFVAKKKAAGITAFKVFVMELDNNGIFSTFTTLKRFFIQAECHGISVFNSSIAVHTQRGFEVLDLQKLVPRTIPELPATDVSTKKLDGYSKKKAGQSLDVLRRSLAHASPMGMFKLSNNKEFLLVYTECAIFVNKSGKISRTSPIRFDFKPKIVTFADNNLFLVGEEVIEIWSISGSIEGANNLIQVIPSKGLSLLDSSALYFKSANPDNSDLQMVFRMLPKEETNI